MADAKELSLSLNALSGTDTSDTIRLRALVGNQVLIILLDSSLVSRLACSMQKVSPVTVKLPNEQFLSCDSIVPDFTWWTQGETFHTPMRVLDIGAYDAILGVDWLKRHGPIKGDWVTKKIKVTNAGKRVWLQGVTTPDKSSVRELPVKQLAKWTKGNDIWALAVVQIDKEHAQTTVPVPVQAVLDTFSAVFAEPDSLPPAHPYDHAIALKPETVPFNVRPYRYSPEHKDEIERQICAMLEAGLITPSMSLFASHVLLVQKKDGSWRFCVDYM